MFLYSQDLSNYKTNYLVQYYTPQFLYSQDLSNYKTKTYFSDKLDLVFVLSRFK